MVIGDRQRHHRLAIVLLAQLAAILPRHADRMAAFLREPSVINDPRLDRAVRLNGRQRDLPHFAQHGLIGPGSLGHEMQQRLMLRRGSRRSGQRGHGLDTLPLARQYQSGAVVVQRRRAIGMADDVG
jgi:hypothetical protein